MQYLLFGLLSAGSAVYYARLIALSERNGPRVQFTSYGVPDAVFALLLIAWFVTTMIQSIGKDVTVNIDALVASAVFAFLVIVCVLCFLIVRSLNPVRLFGLKPRRPTAIVLLALGSLAAMFPAIYFAHSLGQAGFGTEVRPQPILEFFQANKDLLSRLMLALTAIVVAPLSEEFLFRGYLYGVIRRYLERWAAVFLTAALFAGVHAHLPAFAGLFVLALVLTAAYEASGSLWTPILMHATFNTVTLIVTMAWPEFVK